MDVVRFLTYIIYTGSPKKLLILNMEILDRNAQFSQVKVMDLRFPIWKPAPGNDGPSRVRIQGSNANLVGRMQFA